MKIGLLFAICLVVQQNTVSGQALPELLKDAQVQTEGLHLYMTSILLKFRRDMSDTATRTVKRSLSHVLKSLDTPQFDNIEESSDDRDPESDSFGKQISRCSAQADNDIQAAMKRFFSVFNPIHDKSFYILNTVLEQIVQWNVTSDPNDIVEKVHEVLEVSRDEFVTKTVPALEDELKTFKNALMMVPLTVSKCLGDSLQDGVDVS